VFFLNREEIQANPAEESFLNDICWSWARQYAKCYRRVQAKEIMMKRVYCICDMDENTFSLGSKSKKQRHLFVFNIRKKKGPAEDNTMDDQNRPKYWKHEGDFTE